ncbi:helix-turn-helix transcriptional regulator [Curtobacterium sp. DN_7.5]|uniref:helix-turn-helix transcriptional regulator n=1 Tax=Curtobacterium sp. DN_7.5 TaxID=3049047 RepID=UPI001F562F9D|nr:helix-turn-helix transcriptional regulator [Curtobacterium sp. DN_7.5]
MARGDERIEDPVNGAARTRRHSAEEVVRTVTDPHEAVVLMREVHNGRDLRFDDHSGFGLRYRTMSDGRVSLRTASSTSRLTGILQPERQYVLLWAVDGGTVIDADRPDSVTMRPAVPVAFPAGREFAIDAVPGTHHFVHFTADFLEAVATKDSDAAPRPLNLPIVVEPDRLGPLQEVVRAVAPALFDRSTVGETRDALDLMLAEAVLAAFEPMPDGHVAGPHANGVQRAKTFMHARFDRALTVPEIAEAAGVSVRTLQEGFQRHEGLTPMAFLREIRLEKARLGLQLADPDVSSVGAVALSCGFKHMGRFSGAYHEEFGEYPAETLRLRGRTVVR